MGHQSFELALRLASLFCSMQATFIHISNVCLLLILFDFIAFPWTIDIFPVEWSLWGSTADGRLQAGIFLSISSCVTARTPSAISNVFIQFELKIVRFIIFLNNLLLVVGCATIIGCSSNYNSTYGGNTPKYHFFVQFHVETHLLTEMEGSISECGSFYGRALSIQLTPYQVLISSISISWY